MSPVQAHGVEVWSSSGWRAGAVAWLDDQLAAAGIVRTGEVEQLHLRPWATALRSSTTRGPVWLKAAGPGTAFEVGLYELLQRVVGNSVLTPLATDVERGWILLPDGGVPLGGRLSGADLADAMAEVLPQYGQLQRDLAPNAGRLLDLGLADMRPAAMPGRFEEALAAVAEYVERRGRAADRVAHRRLGALGEQVASWCEQLAAAPGPASVDHNDLHPWNILLDSEGRARFYDWGDSVVAHPFASMLVPLGMAREKRRIARLRDAYLEPFGDLAPHSELVETLELACRVGKIARALTWHRAVSTLDGEQAADEWAGVPLECLASLLDDSYLGGA